MPVRKAVIFDIDGVLADNEEHFIEVFKNRGGDWDEFYSRFEQFSCIEMIRQAPDIFKSHGYFVIILTNRPDVFWAETSNWLEAKKIHYDLLVCRPPHLGSTEHKQTQLKWITKDYDVALALEDCPAVLPHYAAFGIPVVYIHSGYYDAERRRELGLTDGHK